MLPNNTCENTLIQCDSTLVFESFKPVWSFFGLGLIREAPASVSPMRCAPDSDGLLTEPAPEGPVDFLLFLHQFGLDSLQSAAEAASIMIGQVTLDLTED